ncbi:MAG: Serine/threonine protein kinase [Deltaproteobacteria bacterium]|nr:Serine/threonine protein kinase [Deltaproteobacteria bacterium]
MYCPVCHSDYQADWKACPKDATLLLKSAQIGKYRIEGLLGVGGMGAVYRASNPDTKGRVAIKVMNPSVAGSDSARARFQREAAAVAALRTSHVVKVYDFGAEPDGALYLVMELMDGHTLREEILPGPTYMDLARVQMVMDGALRGLAAAHKAGIVHRDLKPDNVFVAETDDGEVPKLLDFGIARVRTGNSDLTRTGSLMGTASYMATEQIAAGVGEIGPWSDVYAMGAILYEMLAGTAAFGGNTITEVLQRVLKSEIVPLVSVRTGLPPAIYALVDRCMSTTPANRPQDAEAMRLALSTARLVPVGAQIPPPHKTRPESNISAASSGVGMAATEGHDTPIPNTLAAPFPTPLPPRQTPPPGDNDPRNQIADGTAPGGAAMPAIAGGTGGGLAGSVNRATGERPGKRAMWPFALVGVAAAGIGGFFVVRSVQSSGATDSPRDPPIASVALDASTRPDALQVAAVDAAAVGVGSPVEIDAGAPALTSTMVHVAGGEHDIGEATLASPEGLPRGHVTVPEFWIDREEMTLSALRSAVGNPKLGGMPGDMGELPARNIGWTQAEAACKALGKRLPTEAEWEIAAETTPREPSKAALCSGCPATKPVLTATTKTDCSPDGLCDMLGGVLEWTSDAGAKATRVVRGSSYAVSPGAGWQATIHARVLVPPRTTDHEIGVRCAFSLVGQPTTTRPAPAVSPAAPPAAPAKRTCPAGESYSPLQHTCVKTKNNPADPWNH